MVDSQPRALAASQRIFRSIGALFGCACGLLGSGSLGLNLSKHDIELPRVFGKSLSCSTGGFATSLGGFTHLIQLKSGNGRIGDQHHETEDFEKHLWYSDYRLPCIVGFLLISVGWWDVKLGSQTWGVLAFIVGMCSFFYGCVLLSQSISNSL